MVSVVRSSEAQQPRNMGFALSAAAAFSHVLVEAPKEPDWNCRTPEVGHERRDAD